MSNQHFRFNMAQTELLLSLPPHPTTTQLLLLPAVQGWLWSSTNLSPRKDLNWQSFCPILSRHSRRSPGPPRIKDLLLRARHWGSYLGFLDPPVLSVSLIFLATAENLGDTRGYLRPHLLASRMVGDYTLSISMGRIHTAIGELAWVAQERGRHLDFQDGKGGNEGVSFCQVSPLSRPPSKTIWFGPYSPSVIPSSPPAWRFAHPSLLWSILCVPPLASKTQAPSLTFGYLKEPDASENKSAFFVCFFLALRCFSSLPTLPTPLRGTDTSVDLFHVSWRPFPPWLCCWVFSECYCCYFLWVAHSLLGRALDTGERLVLASQVRHHPESAAFGGRVFSDLASVSLLKLLFSSFPCPPLPSWEMRS